MAQRTVHRQRLGFTLVELPLDKLGVVSKCKRSAFTLVELLVVITIIGMLVALLLPAVNAARAAARTGQCLSNMREVGLGLISYGTTKQKFPGYAQYLQRGKDPNNGDTLWLTTVAEGTGTRVYKVISTNNQGERVPVSWAAMILPYMERRDIWDQLVDDNFEPEIRPIEVYTCPDDTDALSNPANAALSFVVNTGAWDLEEGGDFVFPAPGVGDTKDNGVFHHVGEGGPATSQSKITDGAATTIMVSENLHRDYDPTSVGNPFEGVFSSAAGADPLFTWLGGTHHHVAMMLTIEQQVGMVWVVNVNPQTQPPPADDIYNQERINRIGDDSVLYPQWPAFARPASNHSGGVNVVFCDGHGSFLSEQIDYTVYQQLLTTNGRKCVHPPNHNLYDDNPGEPIYDFRRLPPLSESDFN